MPGIRRSVVVVVALVVAVLAGSATAYAYWSINGSGTGTAAVAEIKPLTVHQIAVKGLVPGKAQDLVGTVSNPNDFAVNIATHTFTVTAAVEPLSLNSQFAANFVLIAPTEHDAVVPAHGDATFTGGSIELLVLPDVDQSAWPGAVITLSYTLTPR